MVQTMSGDMPGFNEAVEHGLLCLGRPLPLKSAQIEAVRTCITAKTCSFGY